MVNINNQNTKIVFSEDIDQILIEILQKYKLEESDDKTFEKLNKDERFNGEILMDAVKKIVNEEMQKKDLPLLLEKELNLTKNLAESLTLDIENKILISVKKINEEETEKEKLITAKPINLINENPIQTAQTIVEEKITPSAIAHEQKVKKEKKIPSLIENKEGISTNIKKQSRVNDSYREPIE